MAFHGLTFPNQNVSSLDDGGFYRSFRGDGIIQGCEITFTTDSITIQAGWLIAGGRLIQVDGATTFTFEDMITTGYGRLMLQIDTSQASTVEDFAQLSYLIDFSASIDGFTAPVQEDINLGTGTIYQIVIAIVQISGGNLTSIVSSIGISSLELRGDANNNPVLNMTDGTSTRGIAYRSNGGFTTFAQSEEGGGIKNGMRLYDSGEVRIFPSDDASIRFLPKGVADLTNQVAINHNGDLHITAGQIHGGVTIGSYTKNSQTNITSGGSWTQIMNTGNVLDPAGLYIVVIHLQYNPNSSTPHPPWFRVNGTSYQTFYSNGNSPLHIDMIRMITGVSAITVEVVPQNVNITSANVPAGCYINYYRIA